jgi:tetratricopeptide (TPR) repeat protein
MKAPSASAAPLAAPSGPAGGLLRALRGCPAWLLLAWLALLAAACSRQPVARVEADVRKAEQERTPDKLVDRGKAFARIGDLTRAEQYLSAALDEGADPRVVLPLLMRVCVESGRLRVAIRHADDFLKRHPDDTRLRYLLGTLYAAVGEPANARRQFEQVLERDPDNADAHYALAMLARDVDGDYARADHHFREYLRLNPSGPHAQEARGSLLKSVP